LVFFSFALERVALPLINVALLSKIGKVALLQIIQEYKDDDVT
jgi:hypothetical protein